MNRSVGFSLIEVVIATLILGVLLAAILTPIGGLFRMNKSSQQTLSNTTLAQQVAERIVGEWTDVAKFEGACLDLTSDPLPGGVTVQVRELDDQAAPTGAYQNLGGCPQTASNAPIKRVRIRAAAGGPAAEVVVDVVHP